MSTMADEGESLESLLNNATNPLNREEDWDRILAFCDQINKELEGPQIAIRLLAHKIQSPQEREALLALSTLESCVKNCGRRFHQEIGKFRFLNEIIKVVSPKYLGNHTTDKVKKKCVELLYSWSQGLNQEGKVLEAYQMLKKQGIVTQDPVYVDKTLEPPPPSKPKAAVFEDEDKSKLLSRLLKSKHPEDLQAANRLIKNMVKQDAERMEKVSKRVQQIETVNNSIKVLEEMMQHYRPGSASDAEKDLMKELYENLEKARPNLFRLASDTDEKDNEGINEILRANDSVLSMMTKYKKLVDGGEDNQSSTNANTVMLPSDLLDFEGAFVTGETDNRKAANMGLLDLAGLSKSSNDSGPSSLLLDDDMLGLIDMGSDKSEAPSVMSQLNKNDLDMLNDIFTSADTPCTSTTADTGLLNLGSAPATTNSVLPPPLAPPPHPGLGAALPRPLLGAATQPTSINWNQGQATAPAVLGKQQTPASLMTGAFTGASQPNILTSTTTANVPSSQPNNKVDKMGFDALEELGKNLMQQSLSTVSVASTSQPTQNLTLNQMAIKPVPPVVSSQGGSTAPSLLDQAPLVPLIPSLGTGVSPVPTPPTSVPASPMRAAVQTPTKSVEVKPLTDISVPLESVQPGTHPPVTAYEKHNLKVVIHVGKDRPRPDVLVMVLSVMSTHSSPIKSLSFQAAVPKIMKVKLQPPSATDLPPYNPILPPTAVTQVMLIANPLKEKIRLKFKLSFNTDDKNVTDVGDVDTFEVE